MRRQKLASARRRRLIWGIRRFVKGAWLHGDSDKTLRIAKCKLQIEESGFSSNLHFAIRNSQFPVVPSPCSTNKTPRRGLYLQWAGKDSRRILWRLVQGGLTIKACPAPPAAGKIPDPRPKGGARAVIRTNPH